MSNTPRRWSRTGRQQRPVLSAPILQPGHHAGRLLLDALDAVDHSAPAG